MVAATIKPQKDASFLVEGEAIRVLRADGSLAYEGRKVFLCRCGHSRDKPLCDGTHKLVGWRDGGLIAVDKMKVDPQPPKPDDPVVTITAKPDSKLVVHGHVEVRAQDGATCRGTLCSLCRCGATQGRPFCDDSHKAIGFKDPEPTGPP